MLRVTVQQLQQLFPQLELMGKRTNDVISMRAFGFSTKVSGCAVRPAMRHQQESVDHLCQYCVQWSYPNNLSGMMCLPTNAPFICVADDFPVMSGAARRSLHARLKKRGGQVPDNSMITHEVAPCPGIFSLAPAHRCVLGCLDTPQSSPLGHRLLEFFLLHLPMCTHNLRGLSRTTQTGVFPSGHLCAMPCTDVVFITYFYTA